MDQLTWEETATLVSTGYHNTALVESINKPESNDENGPNGFNRVYNEQKEGLAYRQEVKAGHVDADGNLTAEADPNGSLKTTAFPPTASLVPPSTAMSLTAPVVSSAMTVSGAAVPVCTASVPTSIAAPIWVVPPSITASAAR